MIFKRTKVKPRVSIIIVSFNMTREIPRTVQSFLPPYQNGITEADIEILVMENGSSNPIPADIVRSWPSCVRYINLESPPPSPAFALNEGVRLAKADWVCPVIDGARMVTPGVVKSALEISEISKTAVIATLGFHLGDKVQQKNVAFGYNQTVEDQLLDSINWPAEPYRLFDISSLGGSAQAAWLGPIAESNVIFMHKNVYNKIQGYDPQFDIPGGGLVNLDFYKRAIGLPGITHYLLMGEGSFHQFHDGETTSRPVSAPSKEDDAKTTWQIYADQYEVLRGEKYSVPAQKPILYGKVLEASLPHMRRAIEHLYKA